MLRRLALLSCAAFTLVLACAEETPKESRWKLLSWEEWLVEGPDQMRVFHDADGRAYRLSVEEEGTWIETTLERADWSFSGELYGGAWTAPVALSGMGRPEEGPRQLLTTPQSAFRFVRTPRLLGGREWNIGPNCFAALADRVVLKLPEGGEPPERARLAVYAGRARRVDGAWYVAGTRFSGQGLSVWSGERAGSIVDVPPGSVLRFAFALEPMLADPSPGPVEFRVRVDGDVVFEHELTGAAARGFTWHAVELPSEGRRGCRVELEVDGSLAYTSFLAPLVGPAETGTWGKRPWDAAPPDIVVFLADTFRADNLAAYGGQAGVTPYLDRLAKKSMVFRNAWSTGTYTLPAHASMFGGVFPRQVSIQDTSLALPDSLLTVAELLSRHGYRTAAVTEGGMVTQRLGLAQGFEWFDEEPSPLSATLERARAVLDADDGRPTFLFVHTYRTHLPYRVSQRARDEHGASLGLEGQQEQLRSELNDLLAVPEDIRDEAGVRRTAERLRAHYLGGVADLDFGFRQFHRDLRQRGLLASSFLLFTSDHGEAFAEHGFAYHTNQVYDELARIPLLVTGPGVEPGVAERPVSLVDFAPTLARMAGVDAPDEWLGRSLFSGGEDTPVFVFECQKRGDSTLGIVSGQRKLISFERVEALERGDLLGAFDLENDPGEERNLAGEDVRWPDEMLHRLAPDAARLLAPLVLPEESDLDAEKLDELRALGYGGD